MDQNVVNWFEIPVSDMARARDFYQNVFGKELQDISNPHSQMFAFPWVQGAPNSAGCLIKNEQAKATAEGTLVYFGCQQLENELGRVESNGGQVIMPKTPIGEFGFIAQAIDTEGNRIGLHSAE